MKNFTEDNYNSFEIVRYLFQLEEGRICNKKHFPLEFDTRMKEKEPPEWKLRYIIMNMK